MTLVLVKRNNRIQCGHERKRIVEDNLASIAYAFINIDCMQAVQVKTF